MTKTVVLRRSVLAAIVAVLVIATGCVSGSVESLPDAPEVPTPPTSSQFPDFSGSSIPPVQGTSVKTPVEVKGGTAKISGRALSGGSPLAGARVRVERFVGSESNSIEVEANAEGGYSVDELLGGRYRVRAFRAPDAAMPEAQTFFLGRGEQRSLDLALERFSGGTDLRYSLNPDPPVLGQSATVTVSLSSRGVDGAGVARSVGTPGVPLFLTTAGGRQIISTNPATTDGSGRATFTILCAGLEGQGLSVGLPDGSTYNVNVSACTVPETTTIPPPDPAAVPSPAPA